MVLELIPSKGSYAGLDPSRPKSNEKQAHHGHSAESEQKPELYTIYIEWKDNNEQGMHHFTTQEVDMCSE